MDSRSFALALLLQVGFSQANLRELLRAWEDPSSVFDSCNCGILSHLGIKQDRADQILLARERFDSERFRCDLESLGVRPVAKWSSLYPLSLAELPTSPTVLFVRGDLSAGSMLAIIGTRTPTDYSGRVLRQWIPTFVDADIVIVSGGAYGVDALAHTITLESGGRTVAVLGTGIDVAYPVSHAPLYRKIVESGGAVISEFPLGAKGTNYSFPIRNATIAGLSDAVFVTEAAARSGSLITARLANDFGRDVFVLPGDVFRDSSVGTNTLARGSEASIATSPDDILHSFGMKYISCAGATSPPELSDPLDRRIVETLRDGQKGLDALTEQLDVELSILSTRLIELEFQNIIIRHPHGAYELR